LRPADDLDYFPHQAGSDPVRPARPARPSLLLRPLLLLLFNKDPASVPRARARGFCYEAGRRDQVERQHLVGVPGDGAFIQPVEVGDRGIELVDGGAHGQAGIAHDGAGEQGVGVGGVLGLVLGPDLVGIGDEVAARLVKQVQQGVAVEVDPDEGACFGWAVKAGILGVVVTLPGGSLDRAALSGVMSI